MKDKVTMIVFSFRDQSVFTAWRKQGKENLEHITWFSGRTKGGSVVTIRVNGPMRGNHENITESNRGFR